MTDSLFLIGVISTFIAVLVGGARAHILDKKLPKERLPMLEVGMRYQVVHSMGILWCWAAATHFGNCGGPFPPRDPCLLGKHVCLCLHRLPPPAAAPPVCRVVLSFRVGVPRRQRSGISGQSRLRARWAEKVRDFLRGTAGRLCATGKINPSTGSARSLHPYRTPGSRSSGRP